MNSSFDKFAKNLLDEDFKCLVKKFGSEHVEILKQKGADCYQYINSFERFDEEKLPGRKYFFRSTKQGKIDNDGEISDSHVSIKDYLMCEKIWDKFELKNMDDYHGHYLKKDVLLLASVFEKFIDTCLKFYGLDPCHYFSSPRLSWDAMLKVTGIKLEKISDIDKYLFIEKRSRGGISGIAKRHAKANKYMNDYDPEKLSTFITCLYNNNFYGWAMIEYLPYGEFEWLENIDEFDINSISEKSDTGYFLEVELHNDYPLAPEKLAIKSDRLSKYYKEIAEKYKVKVGDVKKLIPNLGNKTKYVLHYRNLHLYMS